MKTQKVFLILAGILLAFALLPLTSSVMASTPKQDDISQGAEFVPGELIVGLKPDIGSDALKTAQASVSDSVAALNAKVASVAINGSFYVVRFASDAELLANMDALAALPGVAYVERNGIVRVPSNEEENITRDGVVPLATVNDPFKGKQWYLDKILYYQAPAPVDSANVPCVVTFDTGVSYNHLDLVGKVYKGIDIIGDGFGNSDMDPMDDHGHGTRVAGVIGAKTNNTVGIAGISPYSHILAVKVLASTGQGTYADIANGIIWANAATASNCGGQEPKIYNFSLSGEFHDPTVSQAISDATTMGRLVLATAGDINPKPLFPAADGNVFGVASSENNDKRAYKSNFDLAAGRWLDFVAPGYHIYTTSFDPANPANTNLYAESTGIDPTLGSAVAAGAAARVWALNPTFTVNQVRDKLTSTADATTGGFPTTNLLNPPGPKRLNLAKALGYTKIVVQGQVFAANLSGPLAGSTVSVFNSLKKKICAIATNASGFYTCVLPATGKYTIQVQRAGYVARSLLVTRGVKSIFNINVALSPVIGTSISGDWSVAILWKGWQPFDATGKEFDLWAIKPSKPVTCYSPVAPSSNSNIIVGADSFGKGQTENIRIKKAFASPVQVWVSLWDGPSFEGYSWPASSRITGSGLTAVIYKNNKIVAQVTVPTKPITSTSDVWYIGTINPSTGAWTLANKIYTHDTAPVCISRPPYEPKTVTFTSQAANDGWVLESGENTNIGGIVTSAATALVVGDHAAKKQYRSILSFNTGVGLPDGAVIRKVTLKVKRNGIVGGVDPITLFQGFMVDVKKGTFGTEIVQPTDFQEKPTLTFGPFKPVLSGGWYSMIIPNGDAYINKLNTLSGLTQMRLRFKLDDNNNAVANYLSLFSGDAPLDSNPQLIIEYYVP